MRVCDSVTASLGHLVPWEGTMSIMVIQIMIEKRMILIMMKLLSTEMVKIIVTLMMTMISTTKRRMMAVYILSKQLQQV